MPYKNKAERRIYAHKYYILHRDKPKKRERDIQEQNRITKRLKRYNLSSEDYSMILKKQNGQCAICNKTLQGSDCCVDHNHKSGKTRGLLCRKCNLLLGTANDNIDTLRAGIKYLEEKIK